MLGEMFREAEGGLVALLLKLGPHLISLQLVTSLNAMEFPLSYAVLFSGCTPFLFHPTFPAHRNLDSEEKISTSPFSFHASFLSTILKLCVCVHLCMCMCISTEEHLVV